MGDKCTRRCRFCNVSTGRPNPLDILCTTPPDVLNHNIETVPRLYKEARPGADFQNTLNLLQRFKAMHPNIPTKSGLMVGLGETDEEILQVLRDLLPKC